MGYLDIANMTENGALQRRLIACAATEGEADPETWVATHRWTLCAAPGWADAWASAEAAGSVDPGVDDAVITDPMILSEVQALRAA
jgi:hypothetical protein